MRLYKSRGGEEVTLEPDISQVRRIRIERLEGSTSTGRSAAAGKMTSESHATLPVLKHVSSHGRRKEHRRSVVDTRHRTRVKPSSKDDSTSACVYGTPAERSQSSRITISESRQLGRDGESSGSETESEKVDAAHSDAMEKPRKRKIKIVYVKADDSKPSRPRERRVRPEKELRDRPRAHTSRRKSVSEERPASPPKRSGFHESYRLNILI